MINGLQLAAHLPLFSITLPAVTLSFFKDLQFIVGFDWFESYNKEFLDYSLGITETEPYNLRFVSIGFEEHNVLVNMGCVMFFLSFVLLKILISLCLTVLDCRCKRSLERRENAKRRKYSKFSLIRCCLDCQV